MRISLVNVQFHEGNNLFPPLGVLYVAGSLREAGHRVQVLDGDPLVERDLATRVAAFDPELVGLGVLTMCYDRARRLVADLRRELGPVPLMVGGAHATAEPARTLVELGATAVVAGEGERTAVEVADRLANGRSPDGVAGTWTRAGAGPAREAIEDLDAVAFPARDLCDFERYLSPPGLIRGWASGRHASVLAGRGCPFRCTFCASHLQLGRALRMRSVGSVTGEIDHLVWRYGVRGLYWVDDVFTGRRKWVRELCEALSARPYRLEWACQSRVNGVDRATLEAMKAAGCVQVDFGVESGSDRVLRAMEKGTTAAQVGAAFDLVHEVGMRTGASFILGTPGETADDVAATLALADRIRSDWTVFFFATPYPGTELAAAVRARAHEFPAYGDRWNNRQSRTPFDLGSADPDRLAEWRRIAQNRHFRRNYLHSRNAGYALRLLSVAARRPALVGEAASVAMRGGRLDDIVERWFAADRERIVTRRSRHERAGSPAIPSHVGETPSGTEFALDRTRGVA